MESSAPLSPTSAEPEAPRGMFAPYREDQGRHVRMVAFWSLVFFVGFGCRFLHDILIQWNTLRLPLGGIRLPVVAVNLSPAFVVSMSIVCVGVLVTHRWLRRPKVADLLIETEAELLKVTWPKGQEVWNASMVVIASVVLLGLYLAGVDVFLFRLMRTLILGTS